MEQGIRFRVWRIPAWSQYVIGILAVLSVTVARLLLADALGSRLPLVFYTFAVALTACIGGIAPGLFVTILSLLFGTLLFIPPGTIHLDESGTALHIGAFAAIWLFICVICDLLRNAAIAFQDMAEQRDEDRDRLTRVLDTISDGFFAVDNQWRIVYSNNAFQGLVAEPREVLLGRRLWDYFSLSHSDSIRYQLMEAKAENTPISIDAHDQDNGRWLHLRAFPDVTGTFAYVQDITYRKEIESTKENLLAIEKQAREDAEQASRLSEEFVATLSHELRTPLTSILGWSELLQTRTAGDEGLTEGLAAIERSTKLQAKLVEDLLDMSRINAGKIRLDLQILAFSEVVEEAIRASRPSAELRGVVIDYAQTQEHTFVTADQNRLHQMVINLIGNAVKYTQSGGQITIYFETSPSMITLHVEDTGIGIEKSFLPYVFERFRQSNSSASRSHQGLGLGLAIVKHLVELHGGKIEAHSDGPGTGSLFSLTLPRAAPPPGLLQEFTTLPRSEALLENLKVLLVDDDPETRTVLATLLAEGGAQVEAVGSAQEAIATLRSSQSDLILSDIGMPEMDGYQMIQRIRSLPSSEGGEIPAIAITAFAQNEDRQRALDAGFQAHLSKPVSSRRLLSTVRRYAKRP